MGGRRKRKCCRPKIHTQFALTQNLNQRSGCTDICSLSVITAVSLCDPCYLRRERERFLDFTACQPHMVTPGQEIEGGRGKDQFTKQQHTNSKALCIPVSVSLSVSVSLPLSQPCPNESRIIIKYVNMLIK